VNMDMSQYLDIFLVESGEHLENLNQKLVELEKNPGGLNILHEIFRSAHTLKGMSSTMGFEDMADLTHHMENVLEDLKEGILQVNTFTIDVLLKCLDRLQLMIDNIREGQPVNVDNSDLIDLLDHIKSGEPVEARLETVALAMPVSQMPDEVELPGGADWELNQFDLTMVEEALSRNMNVFSISILVDPGCMMKSVRAFMVFKALEEDGEIIKSEPAAQDLDEGRFNEGFQLLLVTSADERVIVSRLNAISEISIRQITRLDLDRYRHGSGVPAEKTVQRASAEDEPDGQSVPEINRTQRFRQTVRVDIEKLDNLMNLMGELVINKGRLEQIGDIQKLPELNETIEQIDRITTDLQSVVMKVRMVPIKQVFNRFPRMVRDLARELNKEIEFIIEGEETELDRTVIDEIGDPLVHLLRNAIDHGLEPPGKREKLGKPRKGMVKLSARHEGNNVFIEVTDDGQGIQVDKIRARAVEKGLVDAREAEQMSDEETIRLLFKPGFSTATNITDISGRGVGLDVVKNKIESLNGEVVVESRAGVGTTFQIRLPLTLAIIQALLVAVGDETYAIPLGSVDETTMLDREEIKMVQDQEVALLRGNILPLARLRQLLQVPGESGDQETTYVVVVRRADRQIGLVCDSLIGQQEVVIKSLGKLLTGISGLAGATILGDGKVALILDVGTLL